MVDHLLHPDNKVLHTGLLFWQHTTELFQNWEGNISMVLADHWEYTNVDTHWYNCILPEHKVLGNTFTYVHIYMYMDLYMYNFILVPAPLSLIVIQILYNVMYPPHTVTEH